MYGDFPAKNTVCKPYTPINVWFWPIPTKRQERNAERATRAAAWAEYVTACFRTKKRGEQNLHDLLQDFVKDGCLLQRHMTREESGTLTREESGTRRVKRVALDA
jgi:hypothetical protein